jgi:hypothetical protein
VLYPTTQIFNRKDEFLHFQILSLQLITQSSSSVEEVNNICKTNQVGKFETLFSEESAGGSDAS